MTSVDLSSFFFFGLLFLSLLPTLRLTLPFVFCHLYYLLFVTTVYREVLHGLRDAPSETLLNSP